MSSPSTSTFNFLLLTVPTEASVGCLRFFPCFSFSFLTSGVILCHSCISSRESSSLCQKAVGVFPVTTWLNIFVCFFVYFLFEDFVGGFVIFKYYCRYSELFISQQGCFSCPQRIKVPIEKRLHL